MSADNSGPVFAHVCESCRFLGRVDGSDLYFCDSGQRKTIVARHSNEVGDYTSGLILDGVDPLITKGANIARERGYI